MDGGDIGLIVALVILVCFSSCFSSMETAFTGFSTVRMRRYAQKSAGARMALRLSDDFNRVLTTLLIGNNVVNITASALSTVIFTRFWGEIGITLSTVILTITILIFGEITPKTIAKEYPERLAAFFAYPVFIMSVLFYPLNVLFGLWKKLVFLVFRLDKVKPKYTEEEFKMLVSDVKADGVLNDTDQELINSSLRYTELHVGSCMIPLDRVVMTEVRANSSAVYRLFRETNFSRIPVYRGTKENVIGVLYRADFYENRLAGREDFKNILRPVSWTTTDEKISEQLKEMQKMREQMVMVGSEGKTLGLITRDDILEELIGDLDDKYDLTPDTEPLHPFIPEPEEPRDTDETEE